MPVPRDKCVILVPVASAIDAECEMTLRALEARGYPVMRSFGCSAVDQARSQLATDAILAGFEELMWIDSDIACDPDAVDQLRAHDRPVAAGIYPRKGARSIAAIPAPGTKSIVFGEGGGLIEMSYVGAGFLLTKRAVYDKIQETCGLPVCKGQSPLVPYFTPMWTTVAGKQRYLPEDYAFCERAKQCGFPIMADTRIRLWHIGRYRYSWEDAGQELERHASFELPLTGRG